MPDHTFFSLSEMPINLERIIKQFSESDLHWQPESWAIAPGERFTALAQICHLRDIEKMGYQIRIHRTLKENNPQLVSLDGYQLEIEKNYSLESLDIVLKDFISARAETVQMLKKIPLADWNRTAVFEGFGQIKLTGLIHLLCYHDYEHLASLRWLLGNKAIIKKH